MKNDRAVHSLQRTYRRPARFGQTGVASRADAGNSLGGPLSCAQVSSTDVASVGGPLPRRLEIRRRLLTACCIAPIMQVLRHPRRDRAQPMPAFGRLWREHDPADVPVTVGHVIVVVRPVAI
jgi:hypothetical protein